MRLILYLYILIVILPVVSFGASPATETFDNGNLDGWVPNTIHTVVTGEIAGGNPGGFLSSLADSNVFGGVVGADNVFQPWVGDYAAAGINFIAVDLKFFQTIQDPRVRFRRSISENGWNFVLTPTGSQSNDWEHFEINFDPTWTDKEATDNGWQQEPSTGSFSEVMSSVIDFEIRADGAPEDVQALGVDNIQIDNGSRLPRPIPTLSESGILLMTALLALAAVIFMKRRSMAV